MLLLCSNETLPHISVWSFLHITFVLFLSSTLHQNFFQVFFLRNTSIRYLEQLKNQTKTVKHSVWNHNETLIAWFGLLSRLQQHLIKIIFCNLSQGINNLIYYQNLIYHQQFAFCRSLALYKMVQENVLHLFKILFLLPWNHAKQEMLIFLSSK